MFLCPNCRVRLARNQNQPGVFWSCPACSGRAASISFLRKVLRQDCVNRIWAATRENVGVPGKQCPACDLKMSEAPVPIDGQTIRLDICKRCEFIWFDRNEFESIPTAPPMPATPQELERKLPQPAREAIALYQVQQIAERARDENPGPDEGWKTIPAVFGFPVEENTGSLKHLPWVTYSLSAAIALISVLAFFHLNEAVAQFGFVPANAWRYGGFTFLSSFFLHGGVMHLVGNLYFFLIFGDNVEDFLGKWRCLFLIFAAALFGDLLLLAAQPHSAMPCIGASGGISGIIAFYALEFPHARLGFLIRYYFRWIQIPAWGAFALWILLQIVGAIKQLSGLSNVASIAHLGGAAVGLAAWIAWKKLDLAKMPSSPGPSPASVP